LSLLRRQTAPDSELVSINQRGPQTEVLDRATGAVRLGLPGHLLHSELALVKEEGVAILIAGRLMVPGDIEWIENLRVLAG
jgi:hypothetical protein